MGWIGVDLFFVLSGFLITRILLNSYQNKDYFRNFYTRRILRIFPLYYSMLALVYTAWRVVPAFYLEPPTPLSEIAPWIHMQNWLPGDGHIPILGVFWTLAIEEQFYFVWPMLILYAARNGVVEKLCLSLFAFTVLLRFLCVYMEIGEPFYMTFTRLDGLVLGAFVAARSAKLGFESMRIPALKLTFVASMTILIIRVEKGRFYPGSDLVMLYGLPAIAVLFSSLIVIAVTGPQSGLLRKFLRARWLCFFGTISYGMYVFHIPVLIFLVQNHLVPKDNFWQAQLIHLTQGISISAFLAWLSFRYFEKPIMRLRPAASGSHRPVLEHT
jgi:peptidoglycan/LPS O-acetylase OafA/YrhL